MEAKRMVPKSWEELRMPRPLRESQEWARQDRLGIDRQAVQVRRRRNNASRAIPRFLTWLTGELMMPATEVESTQENRCLWGKIRILCHSWTDRVRECPLSLFV